MCFATLLLGDLRMKGGRYGLNLESWSCERFGACLHCLCFDFSRNNVCFPFRLAGYPVGSNTPADIMNLFQIDAVILLLAYLEETLWVANRHASDQAVRLCIFAWKLALLKSTGLFPKKVRAITLGMPGRAQPPLTEFECSFSSFL